MFVSYKLVFSLEEVCSLCLLAINVYSRWRRFVVLFVSYKRVFSLEDICNLFVLEFINLNSVNLTFNQYYDVLL